MRNFDAALTALSLAILSAPVFGSDESPTTSYVTVVDTFNSSDTSLTTSDAMKSDDEFKFGEDYTLTAWIRAEKGDSPLISNRKDADETIAIGDTNTWYIDNSSTPCFATAGQTLCASVNFT